MKYMLITVVERDITTEIFKTIRDAQIKMYEEFCQFGGDDEMIEEQMADITEMEAWITNGNNHDDYDWKIVAL